MIAVSLILLSSCQAPEPRRDPSAAIVQEGSFGVDVGLCQDLAWYFANRTGLQVTPLRERLAPYGFMDMGDNNPAPAPASEGLSLTVRNPGDIPLVSHVEASEFRCRNGILEFGLHGSFDPAATFWLVGIAYGRVQLRLWRDVFGGLMIEVREITDGTVLVVLPIHHRESTWFRFAGFDHEAS